MIAGHLYRLDGPPDVYNIVSEANKPLFVLILLPTSVFVMCGCHQVIISYWNGIYYQQLYFGEHLGCKEVSEEACKSKGNKVQPLSMAKSENSWDRSPGVGQSHPDC